MTTGTPLDYPDAGIDVHVDVSEALTRPFGACEQRDDLQREIYELAPYPPDEPHVDSDCETCRHRKRGRCQVMRPEDGARPLCHTINAFNQCPLWEDES